MITDYFPSLWRPEPGRQLDSSRVLIQDGLSEDRLSRCKWSSLLIVYHFEINLETVSPGLAILNCLVVLGCQKVLNNLMVLSYHTEQSNGSEPFKGSEPSEPSRDPLRPRCIARSLSTRSSQHKTQASNLSLEGFSSTKHSTSEIDAWHRHCLTAVRVAARFYCCRHRRYYITWYHIGILPVIPPLQLSNGRWLRSPS